MCEEGLIKLTKMLFVNRSQEAVKNCSKILQPFLKYERDVLMLLATIVEALVVQSKIMLIED